jgi:hypothetical protein
MVHTDHSVQNTIETKKNDGSHFHLCSSEGLNADPLPTFLPELELTRRKTVRFSNLPLTYVSGRFAWKHNESRENALAAALTKEGCNYIEHQSD